MIPNIPDVTTSQPITLEIVPPIAPVAVVADAKFVNHLTKVERQVEALVIENPQDQQYAANLLQHLTTAGGLLNETRLLAGEPYRRWQEKINDLAKPVATRITTAKAKLSAMLTAYNAAEKKKTEDLEAARQAEIKRQEAIVEAERKEKERLDKEAADKALADAETARQAAAAVAKSKAAPVVEWEDEPAPAPEPPPAPVPAPKSAAQVALETARHAPAIIAPKAVGVRETVRLTYTVEDAKLLPDPFVIRMVNDKAVRDVHCTGWKEGEPLPVVPGLKFKVERSTASTGRGRW